ncbi:MAG: C39 family peptidase [Candidatus Woesearchaeota archaeon]|jgi:uncharacterized protein YvpB
MKLKVPLIKQPKNSVDCGIAGVAMLCKYYNIPKTFNALKKEIETDKIGTYAPQLGTYLIKQGLDVEIVTLHPKLFTLLDSKLSQKEIITRLETSHNSTTSNQDKKVITHFKEFMNSGGKIKIKIPDIIDIKNEIHKKRPVGALMTTNFINNVPIFNFHFNIITGYDTKHIYVNDPLPNKCGGRKKYTLQQFYYGLYASAYGDIDNASLLIVKKIRIKKYD